MQNKPFCPEFKPGEPMSSMLCFKKEYLLKMEFGSFIEAVQQFFLEPTNQQLSENGFETIVDPVDIVFKYPIDYDGENAYFPIVYRCPKRRDP